MSSVQQETITFQGSDGRSLCGDVFRGENPRIAIMISSGTGFPRGYYQPLATHLANLGAVVLTYDYRGIGESAEKDLAGSKVDLPDWARLDQAAAVDALEKEAAGLPITHIAHSVGGHLIGLMPNQARIKKHAFVNVGAGYFGHHHLKTAPLELYFWWIYGTFALLRWGYIKSAGGWRGAPLPPKMFRTWRRWSQKPGYFKGDLETGLRPHRFDQVKAPIRSWLFPDDSIATQKAAECILGFYPNAPQEIVWRKASDIGVRAIGHEGAFRAGREALWDEWWQWLVSDEGAEQPQGA
ncbi:Alpha/beta hydrolase family protein [Pseudovibrio axinellae]|uniref:Alpha/beta hydrolase family protein n=1 Tax=Pseudovibrio axinellae TaxID=989403 RepID=A0A166A369_9HYPH|nr:alpha/beta hydrolase [Pseudovibrio axinellae]KZL20582.1 Alpha/beta hydrolase family protein [Pseudovibrio axinellae]SER28674.1 Predicted alpha/beta hydrolase [Pseudovibrio axinellae]